MKVNIIKSVTPFQLSIPAIMHSQDPSHIRISIHNPFKATNFSVGESLSVQFQDGEHDSLTAVVKTFEKGEISDELFCGVSNFTI